MGSDSVVRAREAFAGRAWEEAYAGFSAEFDRTELQLDDLERQAIAAHLTGRNEISREALAEGYREAMRVGETARAARFAFWLSHALLFEGSQSEATGWLARARQLVSAQEAECVECGYLLMVDGVLAIERSDAGEALRMFTEGREIGERFADNNLVAMSRHGMGQALVRLGRVREAMTALDSVIVQLTTGEVSPMVVGDVYCGVLEVCRMVFDVRRAREWTGALSRWCDGEMVVMHRGPCMVYRAEVMQFHGSWSDALDEANRACQWLSGPATPEGPADAYYRVGELHRLLGNYPEAEEAYREASRLGRSPEPGLPLLWLARGQPEAARAALHRALAEATDPARRAILLDADGELCMASGDASRAREHAMELAEIGEQLDAAVLRAVANRAKGAVLLAEGDFASSLALLRRAWSQWQRLEAPYEAARVRVLIGRAYQGLGDAESAAMEFDAARWVFEQLHARPELAALEALTAAEPTRIPGGLTSREIDVLRQIVSGSTNRQIAASLVISKHTVARHVQNMLSKLGCGSRAALAAYAVERGLASPHGQN